MESKTSKKKTDVKKENEAGKNCIKNDFLHLPSFLKKIVDRLEI